MNFDSPYTFLIVPPSMALFAISIFILMLRRKQTISRVIRYSLTGLICFLLITLSVGFVILFSVSSTDIDRIIPESAGIFMSRMHSGYPFDELELSFLSFFSMIFPVTYGVSFVTLFLLGRYRSHDPVQSTK